MQRAAQPRQPRGFVAGDGDQHLGLVDQQKELLALRTELAAEAPQDQWGVLPRKAVDVNAAPGKPFAFVFERHDQLLRQVGGRFAALHVPEKRYKGVIWARSQVLELAFATRESMHGAVEFDPRQEHLDGAVLPRGDG